MRATLPTLAVLTLALTGCSGGAESPDDSPAVSTSATSASPTASSPTEGETSEERSSASAHAVGDTVTMGELDHTLHGVRFAQGDEYSAPAAGTRWLVADIEVTNNGNEPAAISSALMWTLNDPDNRSVATTYTGDERGTLDGQLGPGRSMRGEIAYEVGADQERWELIFSPEAFELGQTIYEIPATGVTGAASRSELETPESNPTSDARTQDMFTYDEAYAAWEGGMNYYDAFCVNYVPTTDGGVSQCEGIENGTVDRVTGEYIGG